MNLFFRLTLIAAFSAASCFAQTATVTFYSQSLSVKKGAAFLLPKSEQSFGGLPGGWVLDSAQRLARISSGRFATFQLNPGEHSFTDSNYAGTSKPLVINVKGGDQYCIRLFAKVVTLGVFSSWENQIAEVPCEQARREAAHLKPITLKRVDPAVRPEFDPTAVFPDDKQPQASASKPPSPQ